MDAIFAQQKRCVGRHIYCYACEHAVRHLHDAFTHQILPGSAGSLAAHREHGSKLALTGQLIVHLQDAG